MKRAHDQWYGLRGHAQEQCEEGWKFVKGRGGNSRERRRNSKAARANQKTYASKDHGGSSVDIMSAISKLESLGGGI